MSKQGSKDLETAKKEIEEEIVGQVFMFNTPEEFEQQLQAFNKAANSMIAELSQEIDTKAQKSEKLRAEEGKGVAKFVSNSLDTIAKGLKTFASKSGEKAKEIYHGLSDNITKFQKSMKESGVKSLDYLKKSGQFLSDMSKKFGEKLKNLGTKIAINVKDLFGKMQDLCKSVVVNLSKEQQHNLPRQHEITKPKKHVTFAKRIEEVREIEARRSSQR